MVVASYLQRFYEASTCFPSPTHLGFSPAPQIPQKCSNFRKSRGFSGFLWKNGDSVRRRGRKFVCGAAFLPVDPWAPAIDSESIASQLFSFSLFPYIGFLYFITKSKSAPKLTLFGFYFLLAFVGVTIPAGIYAKVQYGTSLANVDWLHGGAESLLTLTNLFIVLGLREALRNIRDNEDSSHNISSGIEDEKPPFK